MREVVTGETNDQNRLRGNELMTHVDTKDLKASDPKQKYMYLMKTHETP